jgi:hypothetical protein
LDCHRRFGFLRQEIGLSNLIEVKDIRIEVNSGLAIETIISMKDMEGEILWEKDFLYDPSLFGRPTTEKYLEADQHKLLKEEYIFAVKTVSDFISHFNKSQQFTHPQNKF